MIRSLLVILSVFCVATLLSEVSAIAFLWYRGQLDADVVSDLRLVLSGESHAAFDKVAEPVSPQPSSEDVLKDRSLRILDLGTREQELVLLKAVVLQRTGELHARQQAFEKMRGDFDAQLQLLSEQTTSEAAERTRGVLQAMPVADAVQNLMQLPVETTVTLLQGLPEKSIAKILQAFNSDPENTACIERGREIFEAITRGEPNRSLLDSASRQFASPADSAAR